MQNDWRRRFIKEIRRNADPRALTDYEGAETEPYHDPLPMTHLLEVSAAPAWQPDPAPQLSIVIGTFERLPLLRRTVESIRAHGIEVPYEIIVIDGGSGDGSLEWLVAQPDVLTIAQHNRSKDKPGHRRRSWGYFMNLGFRTAQGRWILMLSDDTILVPNAISAAMNYGDQLKREGRKIGGVAFYYRNWPAENDYYVQCTLGGMMMINHGLFSKEALEAVGYAEEERYSFYKCDSDLSLKMWASGYEIVDCPEAFVEHLLLAEERLRVENNATMARDRAALIERWKGIFVHPEFPHLFRPPGKKTLKFVDRSNAAAAFAEFAGNDKKNTKIGELWQLASRAAISSVTSILHSPKETAAEARRTGKEDIVADEERDITLHGTLKRLSRLGLNPKQCISLGARSGEDTVYAARLLNGGMRILMVESQLTHEPALRNLAESDRAVSYAICGASEQDGKRDAVTVPCPRVDGLAAKYGLSGPFFLKFDTPGSELPILEGAKETLQQTVLIMMKVYNFKLSFTGGQNLTFDEMCMHLKKLGFRIVDLCSPLHRPGDGVFWQAHFFFIRSDHPVFASNSYKAPAINLVPRAG